MSAAPPPTIVPSRDEVERLVAGEGLVLLGLVPLGPLDEDYARFTAWIREARHAGMDWLARYGDVRRDPAQLLAGARAAIVVAMPYALDPPEPLEPGETAPPPGPPRVAQYARLDDYHKILRRKGERVGRALHGEAGAFRVVVDTAPLLERALAARGARGFIGKNTCFIHPDRGSFLLLAEILTSLPLSVDSRATADPASRQGCGGCTLCQTHCPTGALSVDYRLDASRCLAYWTIEHRGPIPERFWPWLAKYWFGCDICQTVCPFNWRATGNEAPAGVRRREMPPLFDVATMSQDDYERWFGGTPMTRAKREGLRRNALIAMTVTGDARLDEALARTESEPVPPLDETLRQIAAYRGLESTTRNH